PQQVDDRVDGADEQQPIVRTQYFGRGDGRNYRARTVDLRKERAREMSQPGLLDAFADQRARLLDEHLDRVFARLPGVAQRRLALRKQLALRDKHVNEP